ncbi:hypothetical protein ACRAWD_09425 [Caulobacter segnis]
MARWPGRATSTPRGSTGDPRRFQRLDRLFPGVSTRQTDRLDLLLGTDPPGYRRHHSDRGSASFTRQRDFDQALEHLGALTLVEIGGRDVAVRAADNFAACAPKA